MAKYVRTIFATLVLSLAICAPCFAQYLASADNFCYFVVNDGWRKISLNDGVTTSIITIAYGRDTFVSVKKANYRTGLREFRDYSYADKVAIRDAFINTSLTNLRNQGYNISVEYTDIRDNYMFINYNCSKDGIKYRVQERYTIKDYQVYSLVQYSPYSNIVKEVFAAVNNLYVQGKLWDDWVK